MAKPTILTLLTPPPTTCTASEEEKTKRLSFFTLYKCACKWPWQPVLFMSPILLKSERSDETPAVTNDFQSASFTTEHNFT